MSELVADQVIIRLTPHQVALVREVLLEHLRAQERLGLVHPDMRMAYLEFYAVQLSLEL